MENRTKPSGKVMNKAYEMLRTLTISQLSEVHDIAIAENQPLISYQAKETIRRKKEGIWS